MMPRVIETPWFKLVRIERLDNAKTCDLMMCLPAQPARHKAIFQDGKEVHLCDRHALGVIALAEHVRP